jgi:hypothetical protein
MHGKEKDWKKELKKDGTYSEPKPWNPHWKYLEAPIFYSKSGGARYPIDKSPRVEPGRFRVISTWPNKDFAGIIYHPLKANMKLFKVAHRDSSLSPEPIEEK